MKQQTFTFRYQIYKGMYQIGDSNYIGYGIEIIHTVSGMRYMIVEDIDTSEEAVSELIERCNRLNLSPDHIYEVVEDYFAYSAI